MLSWGAPATLWKTLASYRRHGLLDYADEFVVFFNEISHADVILAKRYGVNFTGSRHNVGIGRALTALLAMVRSDYFLFLENDWELVEPAHVVDARLRRASDLIESGSAHVVRLRHRVHHGEPLMTRPEPGYDLNPVHVLDSAHWLADPSETFSEFVQKSHLDGQDWFFTTAQHANYTNNPCIYDVRFLREVVLPFAGGDGIAIEHDINPWWLRQESIIVCQSPGLFMHSRIDRGHLGLSWLTTLTRAVLKRVGVGRPDDVSVPVEVGGPWRSNL